MSSTDSLVVKAPRAGPICNAHRSTSAPNVLSVAASSALMSLNTGQFSGSDLPVPRWSNAMRSRVVSAGAMALANWPASGNAAWPGPPARAITPLWLCALPASRRPTLREIVPAAEPLRSSGTATLAHENPASCVQGVKLTAPAAGTASTEEAPAMRVADTAMLRVRLNILGDVSGKRTPARRGPCSGRAELRTGTWSLL